MEFSHVPVLLEECMKALNLNDNGIYIDGTIGGAGHSSEILRRTQNSKLIGIDRDEEALTASKNRLQGVMERVTLVHSNFNNMKDVAESLGVSGNVDGILIDLGVSSYQLDNAERGFSFRFDSPLDMRMDKNAVISAYDVINSYDETKLKTIFKEYGEERFAGSIARKIVQKRQSKPIETTFELRDIILSSVPRYKGHDGKSNVTKCFQAIRIEVNNELGDLEKAIRNAVELLKTGGRIAIISFHSLEDRIVKNTFKDLALNCVCPPDFPICVCDHRSSVKIVTNHPVTAGEEELKINSRSSSAKLRVAEKI